MSIQPSADQPAPPPPVPTPELMGINMNPQTAQEALQSMVKLQAAQTQWMQAIHAETEEQGRAIDDIAEYTQTMRGQIKGWERMRGYIAFAFWLFIGLPLICTVLYLLSGGSLIALFLYLLGGN